MNIIPLIYLFISAFQAEEAELRAQLLKKQQDEERRRQLAKAAEGRLSAAAKVVVHGFNMHSILISLPQHGAEDTDVHDRVTQLSERIRLNELRRTALYRLVRLIYGVLFSINDNADMSFMPLQLESAEQEPSHDQ